MTFHYRYRKQLIIGFSLFIILTVISIGLYYHFFIENNKLSSNKVEVLASSNKTIKTDSTSKKKEKYYVDIKGQVVYPGLYEVDPNCRVQDVINLAGGLLESADTTVINLGKKVFDEMVIIIYSQEEVLKFTETKEKEQLKIEGCHLDEQNHNDACIEEDVTTKDNESQLVSLNQATKEELLLLPGIGEAKAQSIIDYREENGSFKTIEDIMQVKGIGESLFAKIKDYITV